MDQTALSFIALMVAGFIVTVIVARTASVERNARRLSRLESKVDALLQHHGVVFDPYSTVPPPVVDALRQGDTIQAIKAYRRATGAGLKEARDYVEEARRRASPRVSSAPSP